MPTRQRRAGDRPLSAGSPRDRNENRFDRFQRHDPDQLTFGPPPDHLLTGGSLPSKGDELPTRFPPHRWLPSARRRPHPHMSHSASRASIRRCVSPITPRQERRFGRHPSSRPIHAPPWLNGGTLLAGGVQGSGSGPRCTGVRALRACRLTRPEPACERLQGWARRGHTHFVSQIVPAGV